MKTNKFLSIIVMLTFVLGATSLMSCGGDDGNSESSGITGYYVELNSLAKTSDFNRINQAISNHEVLSSYKSGKYIAEPDLFFYSDGMWRDSDAYYGPVRFSISSFINVYRILDDNTIIMYIGDLFREGASGCVGLEKLYSVYAGVYFGTLAYYGRTPVYYTYVKSGNKIVVSNGDIFTVTESGLIKDGTSKLLTKMSPN